MSDINKLTILVFFIGLFVGNLSYKLQPKIINGTSASLGQFPFYAKLEFFFDNGDSADCGGSLITDDFILTAAHCTLDSLMAKVTLGYQTMNDSSGTQEFIVVKEKFHLHPDFNVNEIPYDVALLRLPIKAERTSTVKPVKLAMRDFEQYLDVLAVGTGEFELNGKEMSSALQYAELQTYPFHECLRFYPFLAHLYDVICVWNPKTQAAIYRGDSGLIR